MRRTGARVVHAHNVNPSFGWRALAAAREAGARVVLHLHNYRLVCAQGLCFTGGEDCTRCHGRDTRPGLRLNCRGGSRAEAAAYAAGLSLWQRRLAEQVDAFVVPSAFALGRLRELGAPVGDRAHVVGSVQREIAGASRAAAGPARAGRGPAHAGEGLRGRDRRGARRRPAARDRRRRAAGRGAARACRRRRRALHRGDRRRRAGARCAREAGAAVVPSRYAEILPLAALEAMAAGLPRRGRRRRRAGGASCRRRACYPPGDSEALAERLTRLWRDAAAGERALADARERFAPAAVARELAAVYAG